MSTAFFNEWRNSRTTRTEKGFALLNKDGENLGPITWDEWEQLRLTSPSRVVSQGLTVGVVYRLINYHPRMQNNAQPPLA